MGKLRCKRGNARRVTKLNLRHITSFSMSASVLVIMSISNYEIRRYALMVVILNLYRCQRTFSSGLLCLALRCRSAVQAYASTSSGVRTRCSKSGWHRWWWLVESLAHFQLRPINLRGRSILWCSAIFFKSPGVLSRSATTMCTYLGTPTLFVSLPDVPQ